jgi:hypothetical protein
MNYAEKNENKKGSEKDKVASGTSLAKSIVLKWLIISRSNILIKKPNSMLFSKKMKTDWEFYYNFINIFWFNDIISRGKISSNQMIWIWILTDIIGIWIGDLIRMIIDHLV